MSKHYVAKNGKLVRTNLFCLRCGRRVFMADRGEWRSCGKRGDRYYKKAFELRTVHVRDSIVMLFCKQHNDRETYKLFYVCGVLEKLIWF